MKRAMTIALFVAVALYLGWRFGWPYIDTRPEQDACEFGPVSNESYRQLLEEAKQRTGSNWRKLSGSQLDIGEQLENRIAELTEHVNSLEGKIAAAHAVMRAIGAHLIERRKLTQNQLAGSVNLAYEIDSLRFGVFDLVDAYTAVIVEMPFKTWPGQEFRTDLRQPTKQYKFSVVVLHPDFLARITNFGTMVNRMTDSRPLSCPPLPPAEAIQRYEEWRTNRGHAK